MLFIYLYSFDMYIYIYYVHTFTYSYGCMKFLCLLTFCILLDNIDLKDIVELKRTK